MKIKEQLYYLIKEYRKGNYTTNIFCDQFTEIYCNERNEANLSMLENKEFERLNEVTSRYSMYEEDLKMYPGVYFTEEDVQNKVEEFFDTLKSEVKEEREDI